MSRIFSASQYEHGYHPHKLQNWEVPAKDKQERVTARTQYATLSPSKGKTQTIVDAKGHLLPGVPKINNAFNIKPRVHEKSPKRWPEDSVTLPTSPAATMGYKGIQTDYLPSSTVTIKTVEVPGTRERWYQ